MGIRARISQGMELADASHDNVINERALDDRGVFDPKKNPFPGSIVQWVVGGADNYDVLEPETVRSVTMRMCYIQSKYDKIPHPQDVSTQNLLAMARLNYQYPASNVEVTYRNRIRSPLTGIRAMCVINCKSGSPKAVARCTELTCPLWPFRMGKNGLR